MNLENCAAILQQGAQNVNVLLNTLNLVVLALIGRQVIKQNGHKDPPRPPPRRRARHSRARENPLHDE